MDKKPIQPFKLIINPGSSLRGAVDLSSGQGLPGDKSLSHRSALLAAMAEGESRVENFQDSGVTRKMLEALATIEVDWRLEGGTLMVEGIGLDSWEYRPRFLLDCGNSATTLRLLAGALSCWRANVVLDGSPGLRRRPMDRIVQPLRDMGVDIQSTSGCAPLMLQPSKKPLHAIESTIPIASAQVKSCILLAALGADGVTTIHEPGPSRDHTERMLRAQGVKVTSEKIDSFTTQLEPPSPRRLAPLRMRLPGDMSAAAFLIVAALITPGSDILLSGVGLNPTRTGLIDVLCQMGGDIQALNLGETGGESVGDLHVRYSRLHGTRVSGELVVRMIDEFPVFAVAAAVAHGRSEVADAQELRSKESDRIHELGNELQRLGVAFRETVDGFIIEGGSPMIGGSLDSHGDHRLAMSLAVAGLASTQPVCIEDAQIIHESFPSFVDTLQSLGAELSLQG